MSTESTCQNCARPIARNPDSGGWRHTGGRGEQGSHWCNPTALVDSVPITDPYAVPTDEETGDSDE